MVMLTISFAPTKPAHGATPSLALLDKPRK
jgi:hypothetical protein